ncbi:hypothetical protein EVAR_17251_1 [Eumeta japonica]|uniref:Uncharacterized protein n=1 Tax=Eumeta variegata TaxID=151549 RepID=A0A4C1TT94_EUMVA|nr:hypothetical protein EVAR_17251_1 [Eumeta japonica]
MEKSDIYDVEETACRYVEEPRVGRRHALARRPPARAVPVAQYTSSEKCRVTSTNFIELNQGGKIQKRNKDGDRTITGTVEIEDEKWDRYHDEHMSTVDINDTTTEIDTRVEANSDSVAVEKRDIRSVKRKLRTYPEVADKQAKKKNMEPSPSYK